MNDDSELEQLKAKRLAEMQKNLSKQQTPENLAASAAAASDPPRKIGSREIIVKNLGYRGLEVLQNAESQFPHDTPIVMQKLAELLHSGEINGPLGGGDLLALFRSVGLHIRMKTSIHVEKDGKFVSLSDKLGSHKTDDQ